MWGVLGWLGITGDGHQTEPGADTVLNPSIPANMGIEASRRRRWLTLVRESCPRHFPDSLQIRGG